MVAVDSVGPSSSGVGQTASPTTWTHTTIAASTTVLVAAALDNVAPGVTASCTLGGVSMTQLGPDVASGSGGTTGIIRVWSVSGVASGAHTVVVTCSTQGDMTGGSIAFSSVTGLGTPATNAASANGSTSFITLSSSTSGNLVVGFIGAGQNISAPSGGATGQFVNNFKGGAGSAVGNGAAATAAAGGSVTITWPCTSAVAATFAVEIQGAAAGFSPGAIRPRLKLNRRRFPRRFRAKSTPGLFLAQQPAAGVIGLSASGGITDLPTQLAPATAAAAGSILQTATQAASATVAGIAAVVSTALLAAFTAVSGLAATAADATQQAGSAVAASASFAASPAQLGQVAFGASAACASNAVQICSAAIVGAASASAAAAQQSFAAIAASSAQTSAAVQQAGLSAPGLALIIAIGTSAGTAFGTISLLAVGSYSSIATQLSNLNLAAAGSIPGNAVQLAGSVIQGAAAWLGSAVQTAFSQISGLGSTADLAFQQSSVSATATSSTTTTATQQSFVSATAAGSISSAAVQLAQMAVSAVAVLLASAAGAASGTIALAASAAWQSSAVQLASSVFGGNAGFQPTATQLSSSVINAAAVLAVGSIQIAAAALSGVAAWLFSSVQTAGSQVLGNSSISEQPTQSSSVGLSAVSSWSNASVSQLGRLAVNAAAGIAGSVIQSVRGAISSAGSFIANGLAIFFGIPAFEESELGGTAQAILFSGTALAVLFNGSAISQQTFSGYAGYIVATYGGTNDQNMATMQNLVALQNNDSAFALTLELSNSPLNLAGYTIKLYTKATELTADTSATTYTVGSGLTITAALGGQLTWVLPRTAATTPGQLWWRVDVTDIHGNIGTCLYGNLWIMAV